MLAACKVFHLRKSCPHLPSRSPVAKFRAVAVHASVLVLAVCLGGALGIRAHRSNAALKELERSGALQSSTVSPSKETRLSDSTHPISYTISGVTQIYGQPYARFAATEPSATTSGLGAGVAEVFDSNGRLIMRYQVSERTDSRWNVIEYFRMPATNAPEK
jgi:hypothetical protein